MAQNYSPIPIYRALTLLDMLRGKRNGMFCNVFECEIPLRGGGGGGGGGSTG